MHEQSQGLSCPAMGENYKMVTEANTIETAHAGADLNDADGP